MIYQILDIMCSAFDGIILLIYFQTFFKGQRKRIPLPLFFLGFFVMEASPYFTSAFIAGLSNTVILAITIISSFFTTLALTFYYHASLRHRLFVTISFHVYAGLSEYLICALFPEAVETANSPEPTFASVSFVFCSKFILLIFVLITNIVFNRKKEDFSLRYNLLILLTPVFSLVIIIAIGLSFLESDDSILLILELASLLLINIINYFLFDHTLQIIKLRTEKQQLEHMVSFQFTKYQQISTAYRNTRSILHDTKKHFFYIQSLLDQKEYDKAKTYLPTASNKLEQAYNLVNTGNLVIDAFLSNHIVMAEQENILFQTDIQVVADHIQIADYDLCVILGNLLDNSFQACRKIAPPLPRKVSAEIFTTDNNFVIHIINNKPMESAAARADEPFLYHGYGLKNIDNISRKYNGNFSYFTEHDTFEAVVTIPYIKERQLSL